VKALVEARRVSFLSKLAEVLHVLFLWREGSRDDPYECEFSDAS
jgi:hypothetical protein